MSIANLYPKISVLLPCLNAERTIAFAIKSILQQTETSWELLILNDGSKDATETIAKSYNDPRIRVFSRQPTGGLASGLNYLLSESKGHWIARMDQDDYAFPWRLEVQKRYLEEHLEVDLLATGVLMIGKHNDVLARFPVFESHEEITAKPEEGFLLPHPTWMGKRSWFLHWGYQNGCKTEDQELLYRAYRHSRYACLRKVCLAYSQADLTVRKRLLRRWEFLQSIFRKKPGYKALAQKSFTWACKSFIDLIFFGTGQGETLLKLWGTPADPNDFVSWSQLKQALGIP